MAAMASTTLLPVVASAMPHGGASTLGLLTAATGAGALVGTVLLAARKSVVGLGTWIAISPALFGLGLVGLSLVDSLWAPALLLGVAGCALLLVMTASNTVLQTIVEGNKRGRVMSLFTMAVTGMAPVGGLLAGHLADQVGVAITLRLAGFTCVAASLAFAVQYPRLRAQTLPIYIRKGIVREPVVALSRAVPMPALAGDGGRPGLAFNGLHTGDYRES